VKLRRGPSIAKLVVARKLAVGVDWVLRQVPMPAQPASWWGTSATAMVETTPSNYWLGTLPLPRDPESSQRRS
jgi:hypothetical protein